MPNRDPIRCFEGSAQPHQPFWNFVDAESSESGATELELYGVISEYSWFDDDITPAKFKKDLYDIGKGGPVLMKVNSPGGDVIAASVMRSILTDYPGDVIARVDGIAASAAVAVTTAANRVTMLDSAYMMIHDPAVVVMLAYLDIETLGRLHDQLNDIKDGIVNAYETRTGLGPVKLARMMSEETWMSARQAVDFGFADEVIEGGQKKKKKKKNDEPETGHVGFINCLNGYRNVPVAVMQAFTPVDQPEASSVLTDEMKREANDLRERVQTILRRSE